MRFKRCEISLKKTFFRSKTLARKRLIQIVKCLNTKICILRDFTTSTSLFLVKVFTFEKIFFQEDCYIHDIYFTKDGETWNTKTCETCTCKLRRINCSTMTCPAIRCPDDSILTIPEGECCPICEERESE